MKDFLKDFLISILITSIVILLGMMLGWERALSGVNCDIILIEENKITTYKNGSTIDMRNHGPDLFVKYKCKEFSIFN